MLPILGNCACTQIDLHIMSGGWIGAHFVGRWLLVLLLHLLHQAVDQDSVAWTSAFWPSSAIWFRSSVGIVRWNIHVEGPTAIVFHCNSIIYSRCLWSPNRMGEVIQTVPGFRMRLSHNCLCHPAHDKYNFLSGERNCCGQGPRARSHLHSAGPCPSHASFTTRSFCPHLHGNSSPLGTSVTIPGQNYKYSSWHHFHYSQVYWWSSFTMTKELNGLSDRSCYIGCQWGRVPTLVWIGRHGSEGGVGGVGSSRMKMWSSRGQVLVTKYANRAILIWGTDKYWIWINSTSSENYA